MQLKWTEPATDDLDEVEAFISRDNSPVVAIDVVLKIIDTVERVLPVHPEVGRSGRVRGTRELVVDSVPYVVVYRLNKAERWIGVLRVLHDAQHWPQ
ncbi:MAG: type II toxin-antitoxin system RelE/ParE family toxin [Pseudomonadota bacterium]